MLILQFLYASRDPTLARDVTTVVRQPESVWENSNINYSLTAGKPEAPIHVYHCLTHNYTAEIYDKEFSAFTPSRREKREYDKDKETHQGTVFYVSLSSLSLRCLYRSNSEHFTVAIF